MVQNTAFYSQHKESKTGFEMILVEGGTFTMGGDDQSHKGRGSNECSHEVTLDDFWIARYEVTQANWVEIMGTNPSHFRNCRACPVEQVSWEGAKAFIRKANIKYEETYRLPSETEWEFAARGGLDTRGYRYSGSDNANDVAWYGRNSKESTHAVGTLRPNELGIYDMSGNIAEWCEDLVRPYPCDLEGRKFEAQVLRGGSWSLDSSSVRVRDRNGRGRDMRLPTLDSGWQSDIPMMEVDYVERHDIL